ncbi:MAG: hypothetical protein RL026_918 [Pseudomonadota bacterium]
MNLARALAVRLCCVSGLLAAPFCAAQGFDDIAGGLLSEALASNLALRAAEGDLRAAESALAAARARYWPEISLNARYTLADGGRQIEFPLGQLLNPAYQTLNELLVAQGQQARFAPLPDQAFDFQRAHEQDSRLSLRLPLYAPGLGAAVDAQRARVAGSGAGREALQRQVRRDMWQAYARHLQAVGRVDVLAEAVGVLQSNLRAVEALHREGSVTRDQVLRAQAELLGLQQQWQTAQVAVVESRAWVNALRNHPLESPVPVPEVGATEGLPAAGKAADLLPTPRPERTQAAAARAAAEALVKVASAARRPQLALGIDAGTQGTDYGLGPGYNYVAASVLLTWKFFDGGASRAAVAEARALARRSAAMEQDVAQSLALQSLRAREQLKSALLSRELALSRNAAAASALRIAQRQRDEGVIAQVAFLDTQAAALAARQGVVDAELSLRVAQAEHVFAGEDPP